MKVICYFILFGLLSFQSIAEIKYFNVFAKRETAPRVHLKDAVDDIAVWVHPSNAENSVIIATDKTPGGGLLSYDLQGNLIGMNLNGRMNNVDIRQNVQIGKFFGDVIVSTNRDAKTLSIYQFNSENLGKNPEENPILTHFPLPKQLSHSKEVYGLCSFWNKKEEKLYAFMIGKDGVIEKWIIYYKKKKLNAKIVELYKLKTKAEGCVVDDEHNELFVGEEEFGIHRFDTRDLTRGSQIIAKVDKTLSADIEGLALYKSAKERYLFASSQGDNSYIIIDLNQANAKIAKFQIAEGLLIDGTNDTDGIEIVQGNFGPQYPEGLFIAQDGQNTHPTGTIFGQNFKILSLSEILDSFTD